MSICLPHVSKFFAVCCQCLLAEKTTVVKLIAEIMKVRRITDIHSVVLIIVLSVNSYF